MAKGSTISVTFKAVDDKGSFQMVAKDVESLKKVMAGGIEAADQFHKKIVNWAAASQAVNNLQNALGQLQGMVTNLTDTYEVQAVNETRLKTVMQQRMKASEEDFQAIMKLTAAQQELGVIGDEVQLAGAQQIATFVSEKSTLETLIPAMNNLIAQQKGLSATASDAQAIGNLFGKAMQGQASALTKVGITMSEAEQAVIKYGTEQEKAAMLAQIITNNVGEMNAQLAQTDAGKQQQMANALGDQQEQIGKMLEPLKGVLAGLASFGAAAIGVTQLCTSFKAVHTALKGVVSMEALHQAALKGVAIATSAWAGVQRVLNVLLASNPIGAVTMAVTTLIGILVVAYNRNEEFRKTVQKCWSAVAGFAKSIWEKLEPAFKKLGKAIGYVWNIAKKLFGIKDSPMKDIADDTSDAADSMKELNIDTEKYLAMMDKAGKNGKKGGTTKVPKVEEPLVEGSLAWYEDALKKANDKVMNAATDAARMSAQSVVDEIQKKIDTIKQSLTSTTAMGKMPDLYIPDAIPQLKTIDKVKVAYQGLKESAVDQFRAVSTAMGRMSDAIGGNAGAWLDWASNVASAIASAIPAINSLIAAKKLQGQAEGQEAAKGAASAVANIPVVGPALAVAAIASVVAALASIPKFAEGALAYGPTFGLFGEYSGAANNPEVVAPLDRLRTLIGDSGTGGEVKFRIEGRELVGILNKQNHIDRRNA